MNISIGRAFTAAVVANIIGGFIVIAIIEIYRHHTGRRV